MADMGHIMGRITNDLFEVTEFAHHCPEEFFIAGLKLLVSFCIFMYVQYSVDGAHWNGIV